MLMFFWSFMMFIMGGLSYMFFRKYLLNMLLSLEFMMLGLFMMLMIVLVNNMSDMYILMLFLVFVVCEGVLGLSILVNMVRTHGNNFFQSFSVLLC